MPRAIMAAVAMSLTFALGAAAQTHSHGTQTQAADPAQPPDSVQPAMQGTSGMQGMHERMHQMHGQASDSDQPMMQRMQSMQGMSAQAAAGAQSCLASGSRAGLSALLLGSAPDLELSEAQRTELHEILARAQEEALATLTPEQRQRLDPTAPSAQACSSAGQGGSAAGHH